MYEFAYPGCRHVNTFASSTRVTARWVFNLNEICVNFKMASQRKLDDFFGKRKRLEDDITVSRTASVSAENETVPETIETVTPPSKFKFNFIAAGYYYNKQTAETISQTVCSQQMHHNYFVLTHFCNNNCHYTLKL